MDIATFFTNLTTNLWDISSFSVSDILIVFEHLFWVHLSDLFTKKHINEICTDNLMYKQSL